MADDLTPEQRRKNMQAIRSKDTSIEIKLRKALWEKGIRYRKNYKAVIGKPDIAITKCKIAVFCDSDYWHGYDWENRNQRIKSNREYWIPKIERNMERDRQVTKALEDDGWLVLRFWEWQIKNSWMTALMQSWMLCIIAQSSPARGIADWLMLSTLH